MAGAMAASALLNTMWDAWVDARNYQWQYYDRMRAEDWPRLARQVADALAAGEDPSALVANHIGCRPRPSLLSRLRTTIGRMRG